jgi:hypothetical protein
MVIEDESTANQLIAIIIRLEELLYDVKEAAASMSRAR